MADSPKYRGERTGQPAQTQQGGDEPGSEPVTLNWAIWDKESTAYWTALADEYMKTHENVKIEMTSGSGAEKVYGGHYHTWRSAVSLFGILDGKQTIVDGTCDFRKPIYERVLKQQEDGIVMDFGEIKTSSLHYSAPFPLKLAGRERTLL